MLASRGTTKCKPQRWAEARVERAVRRRVARFCAPQSSPRDGGTPPWPICSCKFRRCLLTAGSEASMLIQWRQ